MTQLAYFNLPDVGEGLTEAEIVSWKVAVGDQVSVNQIIVEIETAKSLVELPCPFAGVVAELLAAEGETVEVGKPIIACKVADGATGAVATQAIPVIDPAIAAAAASAHEAVAEAAANSVAAQEGSKPFPAKNPNLVGYGVNDAAGESRRRRHVPAAALSASTAAAAALPVVANPATGLLNTAALIAEESVIAKPPVRKLARDLGVDLTKVTATGTAGEVTREDVLNHSSQ
ncbi:MAG: biotin/lipoyl-containing protein, partial [Micrococcales bacterium]